MVAHAVAELPNEACGYLAGKDGIITRVFLLTNTDHSPEHFSFDPAEQFVALKSSREEGIRILANFHSHPKTPARPSDEDVRLAFDPEISYVIISLAKDEAVINSYRIADSGVEKEKIDIIE